MRAFRLFKLKRVTYLKIDHSVGHTFFYKGIFDNICIAIKVQDEHVVEAVFRYQGDLHFISMFGQTPWRPNDRYRVAMKMTKIVTFILLGSFQDYFVFICSIYMHYCIRGAVSGRLSCFLRRYDETPKITKVLSFVQRIFKSVKLHSVFLVS